MRVGSINRIVRVVMRGVLNRQGGFYEQAGEFYEKRTLNTRLLTRVAINRQRKVAEDELLYHLNAVDPLSKNGREVTLEGSARVPTELVGRWLIPCRNRFIGLAAEHQGASGEFA